MGKLSALNNTNHTLLLTDADLLIGARQNRILNKSVLLSSFFFLLSPFSKTILDVSCIERRRWHYTTSNFTSPSMVADPDLRKDKAKSVASSSQRPGNEVKNIQSDVWAHINSRLETERFESVTESYADMIRFSINTIKTDFPVCNPEKGCNGLAVLIDKKVVCIDIFGTVEIYDHYFPKLRDSAFQRANHNKGTDTIEKSEAYFKVLDFLDNFEQTQKKPDLDYTGAGSLSIADNDNFVGFDLSYEKQIIHTALFNR